MLAGAAQSILAAEIRALPLPQTSYNMRCVPVNHNIFLSLQPTLPVLTQDERSACLALGDEALDSDTAAHPLRALSWMLALSHRLYMA